MRKSRRPSRRQASVDAKEDYLPLSASQTASRQTTACAAITWLPLNVSAGEPYSL